MSSAAGGGGRVLLAAGTQTYRHGADFAEPLDDLERVPEALGWVVEAMTRLGYEPAATGARNCLLDPSLQQLATAVRTAAESAPVVVVYYTGHGLRPERKHYYLLTTDTDPRELRTTALKATEFLELVLREDAHGEVLADDQQPQVLVVLDCSFSGAGGMEALKQSLEDIGNPKVWLLATARSVEYAQQGRFADALRQALRDPPTGFSQEFLGLESISGQSTRPSGIPGKKLAAFCPVARSLGSPRSSPTPNTFPAWRG